MVANVMPPWQNTRTRRGASVRGFAIFFSKNPRLLWKWVGGSRSHSGFFFFGKSPRNSPKPILIFWSSSLYHVYSVCMCTLPNVVGYYDLSVLSMSVMGFQKNSLDGGV